MNVINYNPWPTTTSIAIVHAVTFDPSHPVDYRCGTCGRRYRRFAVSFSCCIRHNPGDCCHAFEQRVSATDHIPLEED